MSMTADEMMQIQKMLQPVTDSAHRTEVMVQQVHQQIFGIQGRGGCLEQCNNNDKNIQELQTDVSEMGIEVYGNKNTPDKPGLITQVGEIKSSVSDLIETKKRVLWIAGIGGGTGVVALLKEFGQSILASIFHIK